jgi:hypothetical protein
VDMYHANLLQWLKGNYWYLEDYISEVWIDSKNFDLMQAIQWAQFFAYYNEIMDELNKFNDEFNLDLQF